MTWAVRGVFLLQLLLGLGLSRGLFGMRPLGAQGPEDDLHFAVGVILVALVLWAFRSAGNGARVQAARALPIVALLIGLAFRFGLGVELSAAIVHIVVGVLAIGAVEMALAEQRRARA